ncbi:MAG: radical SAM/Cys-rich domain protein [Methyloprofundus sp.]|nr:radical SAM/Cys-rich domain protein [Methyloprofundus sp.]
MHDTLPFLEPSDFPNITRDQVEVLQVNLGYLCNLSCLHCHVNAGPTRAELMSTDNIDQLIALFASLPNIHTLDLTGGAPEMHPDFKRLVIAARQQDIKVIDRCNLVILEEQGYEDLAQFLFDQQVEITASLPCYLEDNVDAQRGKGVFASSLKALKKLNVLGYGLANSPAVLNLVFNPQGADLPPKQQPLEQAYKAHLQQHYQLQFNQLYVVTNMPIQRFGSTLISKGTFNDYLNLLKTNYSAENLLSVMCKNTVSIDWQGFVYDCDFNQMLDLPLGVSPKKQHFSALNFAQLESVDIAVRDHCYGCTAGQGSSCGGSLESI